MKNRFLSSIAILVMFSGVSSARLIGVNPTGNKSDILCNGGSPTGTNNELCQDYLGNWLPTVTNNQTLGTSSLIFSNIYSQAETISGNASVGAAGSTPAIGTGGTAASQFSSSGLFVLPPYQVGTADGVGFGVTASTTIPVNAGYENLIGVGAVTLTSLPNISTTTVVGGTTLIPNGTFIILASTATSADAVILQSSGTLAGSQLQLGSGTRSIFAAHNIGLIFDSASKCWKELWYR